MGSPEFRTAWRNRGSLCVVLQRPFVAAVFALWMAGAGAQWINLDEKGPYNPELTEERGEKLQQDLNVIPPLGSDPTAPRSEVPRYENDEQASAALAKARQADAERALAVAEQTIQAEEAKKPWLMPVIGLACALVAFGLIWWLRSWSDRNLPPMSGRL